jgi:salicyloyl-CoA 5-hydroxylase
VGKLARAGLHTVVVGAGPAGLFYALLAKQRMPGHEIVVHERNPADATFGFGVVFSERTLGGLADADPELHEAMSAAGVAWTDIEVRRRDGVVRCGGHGFSAVSRRTLLRLLQERAVDVGVELRFEHEAGPEDLAGADLVLAADGVNSATRERHAAQLQPRARPGGAKYIWFATPQPFDALTFVFVEDRHGVWGLHAYPFEDGTSTFIVETDEVTWRSAGLDAAGELPPGESDLESRRYCEELFAEHLGGHGLLVNNSKWLQFRTLRCGSWHAGNVVLLGDAAHTAHFSVGSGTKMAMEDALALAEVVADADDLPGALARYEQSRRPSVEHIQAAARTSIVWWERFRHVAHRDLEQFAFHFLSRSPMVTRARLLKRDRRFVRCIDRWGARALGAGAGRGPLGAELHVGGLRLPSRIVVAPTADIDAVAMLGGLAIAGAGLVLATRAGRWRDAVAWVHDRTEAAIGLRIGADDDPGLVHQAADAGFDVLEAPLGAAAADAWPLDRVLLAVVEAPEDSEGSEADDLLTALREAAAGRPLIAGVTAAADGDVAAVLMLCDRVVQELDLPCAAVDVLDEDAALTAILARRIDLVYGVPSLTVDGGAHGTSAARPAAAPSGS